jgi:hypothetical protein
MASPVLQTTARAVVAPAGPGVVGGVYALPPEGLILQVQIPDDFAGDKEIVDAALSLQAPADSYDLYPTGPYPVTLTADKGAPGSALPADAVHFLSADLGLRLPVSGVVATLDPATARPRIKSADGDVWLPVAGADGTGPFPAVAATKILIEPCDANGAPTTAKLTALKLSAASQPRDVSLAVGGDAPFFRAAGPLPIGKPLAVDGLAAALNQFLRRNPAVRVIPLTLRAQIPGRVRIAAFAATSHTVLRAFDPAGASATLSLPWDEPREATVVLGANARLREVRFAVRADLQAARTAVRPAGETGHDGLLCAQAGARADLDDAYKLDPAVAAAQCFSGLEGDALVGADLYLRALRGRFQGILAVHPDQAGRPADMPILQAEVAHEAGDARWLGWALDRPIRVPAPFWIVLLGTQGEAIWYRTAAARVPTTRPVPLAGRSASLPSATNAAYRLGQGAWLARDGAPRTRLHVQAAAPSPVVELWRGGNHVPVPLDGDGVASLVQTGVGDPFAALNQPPASPALRIVVSAASAGTVSLSELRVRIE